MIIVLFLQLATFLWFQIPEGPGPVTVLPELEVVVAFH